jgi:hypothetical protein
VADVHETEARDDDFAPAGVGVDWIAHVVPFHRSASVRYDGRYLELAIRYCPTAVHLVADVHETAFREDGFGPIWFGVDWMVQAG